MRGKANSRHRQIGAEAKAVFLDGLRGGLRREDAAAAAGFSLMAFYNARARDPQFAADWKEALALPPAADRRARAYAERGEVRITPANRRLLQRRRRLVRFTADRRELYVAHLIATGDMVAAAAEAGVSPSTVTYHRRTDPDFAQVHREALDQCYVRLEEEALRLRLAAQARLRAAMDAAGDCPPRALLEEEGAEFDRIMKLLARLDRKPRSPESNFKPGGRRQAWTFEDSIRALDKALDALARETGKPRPHEEEGWEEPKGS